MIRAVLVGFISTVLFVSVAGAQETEVASPESDAQLSPPPGDPYVPIEVNQRADWIVDGTIGLRSLWVGVLTSSWETAWNTPAEWNRTWSGMGRRYVAREADVTISNALEAGLGAIWGEDPRYVPSQRHGIGPRARYAVKTVFLAPRRDGHLAPAWGRYVGNTLNNVIENAWLPASVTTPRQTIVSSANGFLGRLIGNMYEEFWPDAHRLLHWHE